MAVEYYFSPVGILKIVSDGQSITEIRISAGADTDSGDEITARAASQLKEYFSGQRTVFDLPLNPCETEFQKTVWKILADIPFGTAVSYGQVAELSGNKKACRAVGNAAGKNPILIVIPCHRVKSVTGIGGFSAGIEVKKQLNKHENIVI